MFLYTDFPVPTAEPDVRVPETGAMVRATGFVVRVPAVSVLEEVVLTPTVAIKELWGPSRESGTSETGAVDVATVDEVM